MFEIYFGLPDSINGKRALREIRAGLICGLSVGCQHSLRDVSFDEYGRDVVQVISRTSVFDVSLCKRPRFSGTHIKEIYP